MAVSQVSPPDSHLIYHRSISAYRHRRRGGGNVEKQREARLAEREAAAKLKRDASSELAAGQTRHLQAKGELEEAEVRVRDFGVKISATEEKRAEHDRQAEPWPAATVEAERPGFGEVDHAVVLRCLPGPVNSACKRDRLLALCARTG